MRFVFILIGPWLLLSCDYALAAEPSPSLGMSLLQMTWALLVVVGLILALYALARRQLQFHRPGKSMITVKEIRPLVPKVSLAVVEVKGKEYLLGVTGQGIQHIADLTSDEIPATSTFADMLNEES